MNTPETDQAWKEYIESGLEEKLRDASARIETERNEARKQRDNIESDLKRAMCAFDELEEQRDDLLDCLTRLLPYVSPIIGNKAYQHAKQAIANVKGESGE